MRLVSMPIVSIPKRWLLNIITLQEKKQYNFYVILIFACFVGLMRYTLEFMLGRIALYESSMSVLIIFSFYLFSIFGYTFILKLCIPEFVWKQSIHLVLIGVFLGILPPIIDSFIYGFGNFSYPYTTDVHRSGFFWFTRLPLGELTILFLTMFFNALVVYIKTNNAFRAWVAFFLCYLYINIYAAGISTLAFYLSNKTYDFMDVIGGQNPFLQFQYVTGLPFLLIFFQIMSTVFIYFNLNPGIFPKLFKRMNHAVPLALTCLLGFTVYKPIDAEALLISLCVLYAGVVIIVQNDFFDKKEDVVASRSSYLCADDVVFFNTTLFFIIAALISINFFSGYMLLLTMIVSLIYNYDFYRGKSYFPSNYKIEGVWGLSAFLAGVAMALNTENFYLIEMSGTQEGNRLAALKEVSVASWGWEYVLFAFLIFGGWSIIAVIKDYKDIDSDYAVGNQTAYVLLKKRGNDISRFHKNYTRALALLLIIPFTWLLKVDANVIFYVLMAACVVAFYWTISWPPSNKAVESALMSINAYLLVFALACHFSH